MEYYSALKKEEENHAIVKAWKNLQDLMLSDVKILRRDGKNTQKNYTKKDLHDPDNHEGMITHLKPGILEYESKRALGSITMNKASGGDGILVELFQILKDDAVKVLHSISLKFEKLHSGHRTGKCQFLFFFYIYLF